MPPTLGDYLVALRRDGDGLLDAVHHDLTPAVPGCPGWTVADLVRHVGRVHRFHAAHIPRGVTDPPTEQPADVPDDALLDWYVAGLATLVRTLEQVDPKAPAWNWSLGPQVAGFWHRRMAQETAVHRWDAESAYGIQQPVEQALAVDGIDEVLRVFVPTQRAEEPTAGQSGTIHVHCTDAPGEWLVRLRPDGADVTAEHAKADGAVRGP